MFIAASDRPSQICGETRTVERKDASKEGEAPVSARFLFRGLLAVQLIGELKLSLRKKKLHLEPQLPVAATLVRSHHIVKAWS